MPKIADQITKERVSLLAQIRPSPSCAGLSCVPKALRVRGALKAAQRRWRSKHHIAGARAGAGWRRKAGHRRDTVTFSASSPDIRAVDHRK